MRKINFNKNKCFLTLVCVLCLTMVAPVFAEEISRSHFTNPVGVIAEELPGWDLAGFEQWDSTNDDQTWVTEAGSLSYSDGAKSSQSIGNRVSFPNDLANLTRDQHMRNNNNPDIIYKDGESIYVSFLIKCTRMPGTNDDYIFYIRGNGQNCGRIYVQPATDPDTYEFGFTARNGNAGYPTTPLPMNLNDTYMVVVKYNFVDGDANDFTDWWINPLLDEATEPTPYYTRVANPGKELLDATRNGKVTDAACFRWDFSSDTGSWEVDDVRVATSWEEVTSTTDPVPEGLTLNHTERYPMTNNEMYGTLNAVSVRFNLPVSGIVPADIEVNGSPATEIREYRYSQEAYIFTGFPAVAAGTTATIELKTGAIVDARWGIPLSAGVKWQTSILPAPTGIIFTERFNFPTGVDLRGASNFWDVDNDNPMGHSIGAGSLGSLPGDLSGHLFFNDNGNDDSFSRRIMKEDYNNIRLIGEGQTAYFSFLFNPLTFPDQDDYFITFNTPNSLSGETGRIYVTKDEAANNKLRLGVQMRAFQAPGRVKQDPADALTLGQYLMVCKYEMVPGPDNDTFDLFINPTVGGLESAETPALSAFASATNPVLRLQEVNPATGIRGVTLRAQKGNDIGTIELDDLRFGTTWESVTSADVADTTDPTIIEKFPVEGETFMGSVTHVEIDFDEDVMGVTPGQVTVNGDAATTFSRATEPNGVPMGSAGYIFSGFADPPTSGTVDIAFAPGSTVNAFGLAPAAVNWSITLKGKPADGVLLYEGFDYANDSLLAGNGSWLTADLGDNLKVAIDGNPSTSNLSYPSALPPTGGRLICTPVTVPTLQGRDAVRADLPLTTMIGEGNSIFVSFIIKGTGTPGDGGYLSFFQTEGSDGAETGRLRVNADNTPAYTYGVGFWNATVLEPGIGHAAGESVFIVLKMTAEAGEDNDNVQMWVNPLLGLSERTGAILDTVVLGSNDDINPAQGIQEFSLRTNPNTGDFELDELRIGTTWESVTPAEVIVIPKAATSNWILYEN